MSDMVVYTLPHPHTYLLLHSLHVAKACVHTRYMYIRTNAGKIAVSFHSIVYDYIVDTDFLIVNSIYRVYRIRRTFIRKIMLSINRFSLYHYVHARLSSFLYYVCTYLHPFLYLFIRFIYLSIIHNKKYTRF